MRYIITNESNTSEEVVELALHTSVNQSRVIMCCNGIQILEINKDGDILVVNNESLVKAGNIKEILG